ncbi:hypothetical protein TTHERM_000550838 (macronuclear) [Tetrahymena thermophila SB210]|uniref:Uncharacterized protein n=1 Tax=Tetrahymena thermophila (strain SB210) TaxID=312017 RepID=W7XLD0_TETTS|nr:hypothetical protein TTHERM_000550838 [Tetrahymena thermophila SB210]EWS76074.1 hypothetical protein TTHERM_000550838 [Tetrahymena thermophila SB210]|eukprot:XP_012651381.1 hypothetical protein TTHERM_000550838 [Tetrahymena thermophila SB210]
MQFIYSDHIIQTLQKFQILFILKILNSTQFQNLNLIFLKKKTSNLILSINKQSNKQINKAGLQIHFIKNVDTFKILKKISFINSVKSIISKMAIAEIIKYFNL